MGVERFVGDAAIPWMLAALLLCVPLGGARAWMETAGDWIAGSRWAPAAMGALLASIVLLLPDRAHLTGDFMLREAAVTRAQTCATLFPQAFPLDRWIHCEVPQWLHAHAGLAVETVARLWGAVDAALLGAIAVAFARALGSRGAAALAVTCVISFSSALALFTGYSKGIGDLVVAVVAIAAFGIEVVARGRGHLKFGIAVALAVGFHRVGFALLPAAVMVWSEALHRHGFSRRFAIGVALPLGVMAGLAAEAWSVFTRIDRTVHLHAAVNPALARLDFANALLFVAPLAIAVPLLAGMRASRRAWRSGIPIALAAAALLALGMATQPYQGAFRDWDALAPGGIALVTCSAWILAHVVAAAAPRMAVRLALVAIVLAVIPTLDILANFHDARGGVARVFAFVGEKPFRPVGERAMLWDYMGMRMAQQQEWPEAAEALGRSVDLVPAPRVLANLGLIEIQLGRYERARGRFRRIVQADPDDAIAWHGYAAAVARLDQPDSCRLAAAQLLRLDPKDREALALMRYLDAPAK